MYVHPNWKPLRRLCSCSGYRLGSACRKTVTLVTRNGCFQLRGGVIGSSFCWNTGKIYRITRRHVTEKSNIFRFWERKIWRQYWRQAFPASFSSHTRDKARRKNFDLVRTQYIHQRVRAGWMQSQNTRSTPVLTEILHWRCLAQSDPLGSLEDDESTDCALLLNTMHVAKEKRCT
jgi:hypothetical protein